MTISAVTLFSVFCIMMYYSIWLALVVVLGVVIMTLLARHISGRSSSLFLQQQINIARAEGYMEEMMTGQKVIKVFCHEEGAKAGFDEINDKIYRTAPHRQQLRQHPDAPSGQYRKRHVCGGGPGRRKPCCSPERPT